MPLLRCSVWYQVTKRSLQTGLDHFAEMLEFSSMMVRDSVTSLLESNVELAWRVCGHVKSNCVVLVKDLQAVGIGAGQQSRVGAGEIAAKKAEGRAKGGASATDGFYPFPDGVETRTVAPPAPPIPPPPAA